MDHMGACSKVLRRRLEAREAYSFPKVETVYDDTKDLILASLTNQIQAPLEMALKDLSPCETCLKVAPSASTTSRKSSLRRPGSPRINSRVSWCSVLTEVIEVQEMKNSTSWVVLWMTKIAKTWLCCSDGACQAKKCLLAPFR